MIYRPDDDSFEFEANDEIKPGFHRVSFEDADGSREDVGAYEDATADIYALPNNELAVRVLGDLDGQTGQVTVLQQNGDYRRFSRWDRIDTAPPSQRNAIIRTLPQCGCGGALGMPRLFDSFAEMSVYFFSTFYTRS